MAINSTSEGIFDNESRKERFSDISERLNSLLDHTLYNPRYEDYIFSNSVNPQGQDSEIACFIRTQPDINRATGEVIPGRESRLIKVVSVSGSKNDDMLYRLELYDSKTKKVNEQFIINPFSEEPSIIHSYIPSLQHEFRSEILDIGYGFAELARILTDCSYGTLVMPEDDEIAEYIKSEPSKQGFGSKVIAFAKKFYN